MSSEKEKLFVGAHNFNTDKQALEDHRSSFRPISEVVIVKDWETQRSQGFGYITITNPEHASDATRAMNRESLDGRQIRVDHVGNFLVQALRIIGSGKCLARLIVFKNVYLGTFKKPVHNV
eukprot:bmy_07038T0